jgi:hypothetical protein
MMKVPSGAPWLRDRSDSRLVRASVLGLVVYVIYGVLDLGSVFGRSERTIREGRRTAGKATAGR